MFVLSRRFLDFFLPVLGKDYALESLHIGLEWSVDQCTNLNVDLDLDRLHLPIKSVFILILKDSNLESRI